MTRFTDKIMNMFDYSLLSTDIPVIFEELRYFTVYMVSHSFNEIGEDRQQDS